MDLSKLPLTYFDRVKKIRPEMWSFIENDVVRLKNSGWSGPVFSVDHYGEGMYQKCLDFFAEGFFTEYSNRTGISVEEIKKNIKNVPELVHRLKIFIHSINHEYHNFLNFELYDRKTFYFTDNLTDNLAVTELEIDPSMVHPPFECCQFVYTAKSIVDAAFKSFSSEMINEDCDGILSVFVVYHSAKEDRNYNSLLMLASYWVGSRHVFQIKREVALFPGESLEKSLKTEWSKLLPESELGLGRMITIDGEDRQTDDVEFYTDGLHLFRIILNSVLYLSSSNPDISAQLSSRAKALERVNAIKSRPKAKKATQEARRESELDFSLVGKSVESIEITYRTPSMRSSEGTEKRDYLVRFLVRGHWRNQVHGKGLKERKIIWIKPHFKGPEMTELVNRPYLVH